MSPTGIKAIIIREGVEAALVLIYELVTALMRELEVKPPADAPPEVSQPDTTTKED